MIGISYFWFLGALVQINMLFFGKELLQLDEFHIGLLGTFLAIGIGVGSLAAGRLSGDHIELGLVPLGSVAMGVFLGLVALSAPLRTHTRPRRLCGLGFSAGLFAVPLNAYLQQKAGREEKGQLIATNNFMNTIGILLAAAIHWLLKTPLQLTPDIDHLADRSGDLGRHDHDTLFSARLFRPADSVAVHSHASIG